MFRGFRWQLIVLVLALAVFLAGTVYRLNRTSVRQRPPSTAIPSLPPAPEPTEAAPAQATAFTAPADSASVEAPYREGMVGAVARLNPLFAHLNPVDRDLSSLIFEGLFAANDYGELVPRLARELVISADGIEYVLRLRDDVLWQDGAPFRADDVVYTMSLLSDPDYAWMSPAGEFWATVETQKLGDRLLRFRLAQPLGSFPHLLTIGILPEHALRGVTLSQLARHPFNLSPIGTGPYQLAELRLGVDGGISTVELARSPAFMRRSQSASSYQLKRLSFHLFPEAESALAAYEAGAVNALAHIGSRERLLSLPRSQVYTQAESSAVMLIFNWKEAQFAERRLRQALSLSLDVPATIQDLALPDITYADSPYPPGSSVYQPQEFWLRHDPAQARALLEAARIPPASDSQADDGDSREMRFRLLIEDQGPPPALAESIAAQWQSLGVQLEIEAVAAEEFANRLETGRFQMAVVSLPVGGDFDLYRYWHPAQFDKGRNYGAASNHETAELIERARREIYSSRRAALYSDFQAAFAEQAIAIPLYYPLYTFVVSDELGGLQLGYLASPADRFRGIAHWRTAALNG